MSIKEEIGDEVLSIDCLPNESLETVLKSIPIIDRISWKRASKRWNALLKESFGKQMVVSHKDFPGIGSWTNTNTKLQGFFARYGQNIVELSAQKFNFRQFTWDLFSLLPNLRHLDITDMEMTSDRLVRIADLLPNLLSFSFDWFDEQVVIGLEINLVRFEKLEFLRCRTPEGFGYFSLPPTLKYFELDACNVGPSVMRITQQDKKLESLLLGNGIQVSLFYTSFNFESLKYLSIWAGNSGYLNNAERLLEIASNLLALELEIDEEYSRMLTGWLNAIGRYGKKLQHVGVTCDRGWEAKDASVNLGKLISLSIYHRYEGRASVCADFHTFFEQVAAFGKLEYFNTNFHLSSKLICKAVKSCKSLKQISCKYDYSEDWDCLLKTLDEIHGIDAVPSDEKDYKQVMHLFCCHQIIPIKHPWLRFHGEYSKSPIAEHIRFGCLSAKPKFKGSELD